MPRIVLFEDGAWADLLPLTYWHSVFELRAGRRTLLDRAAERQGAPVAGIWTRDWIAAVAADRCRLPVNRPADPGTVLVNGLWLMAGPTDFADAPYVAVGPDQRIAYIACDATLARRVQPEDLLDARRTARLIESFPHGEISAEFIRYPWELIHRNAALVRADWSGADDAAVIGHVHETAVLIEPKRIHVGDKALIKPLAVLDASEGPVYISENAIVESHAVITGPAAIGPGTIVRAHAVIHGGTSIGPVCKVGGEIDGCIIAGYSNKQHEGFLGHTYVGNWVNLGAGATNSDLKNTYGTVRAMLRGREHDTGQMFCGAVIADHVKLAIGQMIPTGASIGFAANSASGRMLPKFVPSFAWITDAGTSAGDVQRLLNTAEKVMARRHIPLTEVETKLFRHVAALAPTLEQPSGRA